MISPDLIQRPNRNGVTGRLLPAFTPFFFVAGASLLVATSAFVGEASAANDPVAVESLSESSPSSSRTSQSPQSSVQSDEQIIEYREPIEEDSAGEFGGFEMQYQMQVLQQEVQELRGLVEELSYQLRRMQSTQEDRYLELDGRFQNLQEQINSGVTMADPAAGTSSAPATPDEVGVVTSSEATEDELYGTALEQIRSRQYDQAITQLSTLIAQYPDGVLTANAYYWLGEVYAAKPEPEYENARQALSQVISFFPDSRKVPDAKFKLGKVHHLMGDCAQAETLLNQVIAENSGRSVAKLAETYLRDKVDCGS